VASIIKRIFFEMVPKKVISVVSDNGKNMVKAWDKFLKIIHHHKYLFLDVLVMY